MAAAASALLYTLASFFPLDQVRLPPSISLFVRWVAFFLLFFPSVFPSSSPRRPQPPLSASGAVVGQERRPNPVLIETRALIELSRSDG